MRRAGRSQIRPRDQRMLPPRVERSDTPACSFFQASKRNLHLFLWTHHSITAVDLLSDGLHLMWKLWFNKRRFDTEKERSRLRVETCRVAPSRKKKRGVVGLYSMDEIIGVPLNLIIRIIIKIRELLYKF